ncbi:MAG: cytochrome c [Alphaproteobacteria bacterium]|nr:cytochrome c [Alphaproteobacteria bacterium]
MAKRTIIFLALGVALAAASPSLAKPLSYILPDDSSAFRPGPGVEAAQKNCAACHSADYISIQPPNKGSVFWDAEVQKMIKVYHAPIDQNDVKSISEYLAKTY